MKCRRAFTKFGDISENLQWFSRQQQRQGEDRQKTRIFSVLDQPNSKGKYFENIIDRIYCLQTKSLLVKGEDTRKKNFFFLLFSTSLDCSSSSLTIFHKCSSICRGENISNIVQDYSLCWVMCESERRLKGVGNHLFSVILVWLQGRDSCTIDWLWTRLVVWFCSCFFD